MTTATASSRDPSGFMLRLIAWGTVSLTFAFLIENWLVHWQQLPGLRSAFNGGYWAAAVYFLALVFAIRMALRPMPGGLRGDSARISAVSGWIARAAFWIAVLVGTADAVISFLRIEEALHLLVGDAIAAQLQQPVFRGQMVHMPLAALGILLAFLTRGLSFIWLTLLVVVVQLITVIGRFVFSYEQAFLGDLVRLWYAALFLFSAAYTLLEEGHVRVDIFYANMSRRAKALVDGLGSIVFGMGLMWIILILGTATNASPIIGPFLRYEQGQQSFGLATKYWMAAFLAIFAALMLVQFAAYLLKAGADWRNEPVTGKAE